MTIGGRVSNVRPLRVIRPHSLVRSDSASRRS
jgi:hypothetical protein